jgi:hypothetical protein
MANSSINLSSLDFDTLKSNFKEYLKTQSVFKDYNFEGSNINVLLDIMSYNSYLNSFYLNMVASEMFLDSAQKYDSVVSHAKELNYVPRSAAPAVANVSFSIETSSPIGIIEIQKGTRFNGINSNGTYDFITTESTTYTSSNNSYTVNNLLIFEGSYFQDSFVKDDNIESQRFVLSNQNIFTDSIYVSVVENNDTANPIIFSRAETLYQLDGTSKVFFLQGCENNQYEIVFGDGLFGRTPLNGATITVSYVVTNGTDGNGIGDFTLSDDLSQSGTRATTSDITINVSSQNGANQESIETVRYNAPRYFATQQRAVSSDDYASLIKAQFGGQIEDVIIYGGQELEPKQYGTVVVCLKPKNSTIVPDYLKSQIQNYLIDFIALPNRVAIAEPDYFYIYVSSTVQYDSKQTTKSVSDVRGIVIANMISYAEDHIGLFGNDFRYSKFVAHIDNSDTSITSNNTEIKMIKRLLPTLNYYTDYTIDFNNKPEREGLYYGQVYPDERVLSSSSFTYVHTDGVQYQNAFLEDVPRPVVSSIEDSKIGDIAVYYILNNQRILINPSIGIICYETNSLGPAGRVTLNKFRTSAYNNYISLYLTPSEKDIIANKNMVLLLAPEDITTNVIETVK